MCVRAFHAPKLQKKKGSLAEMRTDSGQYGRRVQRVRSALSVSRSIAAKYVPER